MPVLPSTPKEFDLTTLAILKDFTSITQELDTPVEALGFLKPQRSAKDSVLRTLFTSLFGATASTIFWKDKSRYIATTGDGVHVLIFKGKNLDSRTHYTWSAMENVATSVDDQFVNIGFTYEGTQIAWKILRYQIVEPDGSCVMDAEDIKQIGEMTSSLEARFSAVRAAGVRAA